MNERQAPPSRSACALWMRSASRVSFLTRSGSAPCSVDSNALESRKGTVPGPGRSWRCKPSVTRHGAGAGHKVGLAPDLIRAGRQAAPPGVRIGAGTVRGLEDLRAALEAGAEFIVTPVVVEDVIRRCRSDGVFIVPGAFTPTEIHRAWDLGADLVKLFPADQLGPAYVRSVKGPLPEVKLCPTGGITVESIAAYRLAGAEAFGIGGQLFQKPRVEAGDWEGIERDARRYVEAWRASTGSQSR